MAFTDLLDPCLWQADRLGPSVVSLEPLSLFSDIDAHVPLH